jgi:hypothetical protein
MTARAPRTRSLEEWCGQGRKGRSFENASPGRFGPLPPQACARRGAARSAAKVGTFARRVVARKRGPCGDLTAKTRTGPVTTRSGPVPRSHPRKRGPCSVSHRPATQQAPHLAQSNKFSSLSRDRAIRADDCVDSSLCRPATRRPRRLARPRRAEQVPSGLPDGCDPGAGCSAGAKRVLVRAYTVASPQGAPAPCSGARPESPRSRT